MDLGNRSHEETANLSIGNSEVSLSGLTFELDHDEPGARSSTEESHGMPATSTPPTSPPNNPFMFTSFHPNMSKENLTGRVSTPTKPSSFVDATRSGSPAQHSPLGGSPFARTPQSRNGSPFARSLPKSSSSSSLIGDLNGSPSGRSPRITREGVQKKLEKQRSLESPLRESVKDVLAESEQLRRSVDSPTHPQANTPNSSRHALKRIPPPKLTREPTYDGVLSLDPDAQPSGPPPPSLFSRSHSTDDATNVEGSSLANLNEMKSALDRLMADVAGEATLAADGKGVVGLKIEAVTEGIQAGRFSIPSVLPTPTEDEGDESNQAIPMDAEEQHEDRMDLVVEMKESDSPPFSGQSESLLQAGFLSPEPTGVSVSRPTSPQPQTKDAIRTREKLIKAMKQRKREQEQEEEDLDTSVEYFAPPRRKSVRLPSRRRSRSTGDALEILEHHSGRKRAETLMTETSGGLLDSLGLDEEDDLLADSIDRELRRLKGPNHTVSISCNLLLNSSMVTDGET